MKSRMLFIMILLITFGGIYVADILGFWQTESTKVASIIEEGDYKGLANPEDIRGSYTFLDIENSYGIDSSILAKAFNIKTDNPDTVKTMEIEEAYSYLGDELEIGTGSVRLFVAIYTGVPYTAAENIPSTAVSVLKDSGKWSDTLQGELAEYIIQVEAVQTEAVLPSKDDSSEQHEASEGVTGKTTVKEVIAMGITLEELESIIGAKIENQNLPVKDVCDQNGLSFPTVKGDISKILEDK
ncbi:MAG: hypothetical protein WBH44_05820 [Proteocatella sp.]